jgi:hypothetical protein
MPGRTNSNASKLAVFFVWFMYWVSISSLKGLGLPTSIAKTQDTTGVAQSGRISFSSLPERGAIPTPRSAASQREANAEILEG